MSQVVVRRMEDAAGVAVSLVPRHDVVAEEAAGDGRFVATHGPFSSYERTVRIGEPDAAGRREVVETVDFRLAVPFWRFVFVWPYRSALRRPPGPGRAKPPWWAPPERLDERAATVLGLLCGLAVVGGYLGTIITQTITFASSEFGASKTAQGATLAAVRVGVLLALTLTAIADRQGRRRLLVVSAAAGCIVTVTTALAPNLVWFGITQTVARGFTSGLVLLITIVSAEEMPAGARAYGFSLITMAGALGAGMCLWFLRLADAGAGGWRSLYVIAILGLPIVVAVARRLPESQRFEAPHTEVEMRGHGARFWLLAVSGFLLAAFGAPATQFQNEFLRDQRGFSAGRISIFVILTTTPGAIGIVAGGRLADVWGRRMVAAVGIVGGTVLTIAMFDTRGWPMWAWSTVGAIAAGLVVPSMGVYRPELFPTSLRGRSAGVIEAVTVAGSALGLVVVGRLADRWGNFGTPLTIFGAGSVAVAAIVLLGYPETARRSLEDLNPEDRGGAGPIR